MGLLKENLKFYYDEGRTILKLWMLFGLSLWQTPKIKFPELHFAMMFATK